jgi:hypothetical protein
MGEPLWDVFTPEVVADLQQRQAKSPTDLLNWRLAILQAGGLDPSRLNQELRAFKAAWEAYLTAAFTIGLFDGKHGADLRARLAGPDDINFLSAISECFAAWYLAGHRRLQLLGRPAGQGKRCLEFSIVCVGGNINVEVKAPYRPLTPEFFWGDDSDLLEGALLAASKQFAKGQRNLLVVHPRLRLSIFPQFRIPLERAFVGEEVIRIPIDPRTGGPAGPTTMVFKESGRLLKRWRQPPPVRLPQPRYTRVSALLCLNEYEENGEVKSRALFVHNPNAERPLPREMWRGIPEFFRDGYRWRWSDEEQGDLTTEKPSPFWEPGS